MRTQLVDSNFVIAAQQFNPSIFSQLWLVQNGIASENDFKGESVFTPAFAQVRSPRFVLLVLPQQLQFAPLPVEEQHGELVADAIGSIVRLLPETPYVAVGLNLNWLVEIEPKEYPAFSRALFYRENPLYEQFVENDARFGGYLSKDILGARLKLDVKPKKTGPPGEEVEKLLFAFNFHVDVRRDNQVDEILRMANQWDSAMEHAVGIIEVLENWKWK